jgi:hypothetical protein
MTYNLFSDGLAVVPIPLAKDVEPWLINYLADIPEVSHHQASLDASRSREDVVANTLYSSSGFGALNEPSSYHNKPVRLLRTLAKETVQPVLQEYARSRGWTNINYEQLIDRLLVRHPSQKPMTEKAHRDEAINALAGDTIFGGWIAMSDGDGFTAALGSHRQCNGAFVPSGGIGFAPLTKAESSAYTLTRVEVPKYSIIVFHANMVHSITARSRKTPLIRLFVGHRLTTAVEPLYVDDAPVMKKNLSRVSKPMAVTRGKKTMKAPQLIQKVVSPGLKNVLCRLAVPPLPSGQHFPIISPFAYSMHKAKKYKWITTRYRPQLFGRTEWPAEPLPWEDIAYMDATRLLLSRPDFPKYTQPERALHFPQPL